MPAHSKQHVEKPFLALFEGASLFIASECRVISKAANSLVRFLFLFTDITGGIVEQIILTFLRTESIWDKVASLCI